MVMTGLSAAANNRRGINQTPAVAITVVARKSRRDTSKVPLVFTALLRFCLGCLFRERGLEGMVCLLKRASYCGRVGNRVEQDKIVDRAVIAY